jgi:multidrug transporter EmrE-like cation transporter
VSWVTWVLILSGVALNAAAQLMLKLATRGLAHFTSLDWDTLQAGVLVLARSVAFWCGMVCYGTSLCVWLAALAKAPVSTAYPMLSLGYVVVTWVSVTWMGESLSVPKVVGIALICGGVFLVSRSSV